MNTPSKFIKTASEAEDKLSKLPECILNHILSCLPTKDAAKTSILSKRWRFLFLAVPKIDLIDRTSTSGLKNALVRFINRRLVLCRTASITEFRLRCAQLPRASVVHLWLTAIALSNVQVLDIQIELSSRIPVCLLSEHFAWETLMVLKLNGEQISFKLPESVLFPNLKILNLKSMKLLSQSESYKFSDQAFPRLEDLRLEHVIYGNSGLKRLAIAAFMKDRKLKLIDIRSPQLQHLEMQIAGGYGINNTKINMCNLESIVSVCFIQCYSGDQLTESFSKVNCAKELDLSGWAVEGLLACVSLPQFPNLTRLKMCALAEQSMWSVLQYSPNLEALDIEVRDYIAPDDTFGKCWAYPENAPPCFGRTLREICIRAFGHTEAEIEAVGFILQHGVLLHRLILHRSNDKWKFSTSTRLLKLKRRSPNCEIQLV